MGNIQTYEQQLTSYIQDELQPVEDSLTNLAYISLGTGGVWRIMYPGGSAALVPWVGLIGGTFVLREFPNMKSVSGGMAGLGAGVFVAELMQQNKTVGGVVGALAGSMFLHSGSKGGPKQPSNTTSQ